MGAGWFYASRALSAVVIEDLGWTRTMWASGLTPMLIVSSVSQAFVGSACVRFGVRPVVVASVICLGVSVAAFSSMQNINHFYAAMMLLALANAGIGDVSIGSVITKWFSRRRSVALGFAMIGSNLGSIVYISAMASVLPEMGWRQATLIVGLGGVATILPFAFFAVRDPGLGEGAAMEEDSPGEDQEDVSSVSLREAIRHPTFWILFFSLFCYSLVQIGMIDQLVLYLTDLGYSQNEAMGALGLAVGAGIAAKLCAGAIGQVVSTRTAYLANTGLLALSLLLVPFSANGWILTAFTICFGLATSSRDVFLPLAVAEAFGAKYFAQIYGVMILAFIPGGALGPLVLAEAHRVFGNYRPGFMASMALTILACVAISFLPRTAGAMSESAEASKV